MGLPADTAFSYMGSFDSIASMVTLFGRDVIAAFT
jgi:hypothetical protein